MVVNGEYCRQEDLVKVRIKMSEIVHYQFEVEAQW